MTKRCALYPIGINMARSVVIALLLGHGATRPLASQIDDGTRSLEYASVGTIIGWIQKLSGPGPFLEAGLTIHTRVSGQRLRLTGTIAYAYDHSDIVDPIAGVVRDSAEAWIATLQPTLEFPLNNLSVGAGANLHYFFGNDFKGFLHPSVTARASAKVAPRISIGAAANLLAKFSPDDFKPLLVGVSTTHAELVVELFVILDLSIRRH